MELLLLLLFCMLVWLSFSRFNDVYGNPHDVMLLAFQSLEHKSPHNARSPPMLMILFLL